METQFKQVPRPSFKEIQERLRKTEFWPKILAAGRRMGKSSIHTWYLSRMADIAYVRVSAEYAAAFNHGSGKEVLEIETAITGLANMALLDSIRREIEETGTVTEKAAKWIELHRRLQASSARREAERRASGRMERQAYNRARDEMQTVLVKQPDALRIVLDALNKVEAEAAAKRGDEPALPSAA